MTFVPENLGLATTGLPLLRDLVHERTGLFYDDARLDYLGDRIAPLVLDRGFRTFLDFYYLLKYDERSAAEEWGRVLDALSVQETYFWREVDQIRALACAILPGLEQAARRGPIRIWSAPCASGEEPLTIAMMLSETGWFDRLPVEIHASDGSSAAIAKARRGVYGQRSFRALPPALREKYFIENDSGASPVPELSRRISSWSVVNLVARDEVAPHAGSHVIFCRNAFIYFSPTTVKQVVETFADRMPSPAYLFVAASESLLRVTDRFRLDDVSGAFVYVKN